MTTVVARRRLLLAAAGLAATACLPRSLRTPTAWRSEEAPPGSPLAARPSADHWPDAFRSARPLTQEAYRYAVANEPVLRYIPCYCGCAAQGHRDNFDCYVTEQRANGWVVLSDHAFG